MKTLVAYASRGGASERYAGRIAEKLRDRGFEADLVDLRTAGVDDLEPYGSIVVGAGVRIGRIYGRARRFLGRGDLAGKPLAVFLASGMAVQDAQGAARKYLEPLLAKCGLDPVMTGSFPGVMPGPGGRRPEESDPAVVDRWAEELASRLGAARPGTGS